MILRRVVRPSRRVRSAGRASAADVSTHARAVRCSSCRGSAAVTAEHGPETRQHPRPARAPHLGAVVEAGRADTRDPQRRRDILLDAAATGFHAGPLLLHLQLRGWFIAPVAIRTHAITVPSPHDPTRDRRTVAVRRDDLGGTHVWL